jgi:hypothetical protein
MATKTKSKPLHIAAQLEDIAPLQDGWMNGLGIAPDSSRFQALALALQKVLSSDVPLPHLYPTPEGEIRAEWLINDIDASINIDLTTLSGDFHSLNLTNDEEVERQVSFVNPDDLAWIIVQLTPEALAS